MSQSRSAVWCSAGFQSLWQCSTGRLWQRRLAFLLWVAGHKVPSANEGLCTERGASPSSRRACSLLSRLSPLMDQQPWCSVPAMPPSRFWAQTSGGWVSYNLSKSPESLQGPQMEVAVMGMYSGDPLPLFILKLPKTMRIREEYDSGFYFKEKNFALKEVEMFQVEITN